MPNEIDDVLNKLGDGALSKDYKAPTPPVEDKVLPTDDKTPPVVPPVENPDKTPPVVPPVEKKGDEEEEDDTVEVSLDDKGNLVDGEGNIIVEAKDVKKDKAGNVIVPETIEEKSKDSNVTRVQKTIEAELGIALTDDNGAPLVFDNTIEGLVTLTKEAVERGRATAEEDLLNAYPALRGLLDHVLTGKSEQEYFRSKVEVAKYNKVVIPVDTDKNIESNKLIRKNLIVENHVLGLTDGKQLTDEQITAAQAKAEKYAEYIIATGGEKEEAALALQELQARDAQKSAAIDAQNRQRLIDAQVANETYWTGIKTVVDDGKLGQGIVIPKAEREDFFKYLAIPVDKSGKSREQIATEKETANDALVLSYLRYKNFSLEDLIARRVKQAKAEELLLTAETAKKHIRLQGKGEGLRNKAELDLDDINLSKFG